MKYLHIITILIFITALSSCNEKKKSLDAVVHDLAVVECRAMQLKDKRFELADRIRFTEDTILKIGASADTMPYHEKMVKLAEAKELLLKNSLLLADSIKTTLDSVSLHYFTDKKTEKEFAELLDAALKANGCR